MTREQLTSPHYLKLLYVYAVKKNWIADSEAARLQFFALAHFCSERGKKPGAYFSDCLRKRRFGVVRWVDECWAAREIHGLRIDERCEAERAEVPNAT